MSSADLLAGSPDTPSAGHRTATNPAPFRDGSNVEAHRLGVRVDGGADLDGRASRILRSLFVRSALPMKRFTEWNVFLGSLVRRFAATCPTATEPSAAKCTTLGIVRRPFSSGTSTGRPSITTATQLLVVPRSMPQMEAWTDRTARRSSASDSRARAGRRAGGRTRPRRAP